MRDITIFVAEDSTLLRRLVVDQLNRETGFTVIGEAEDGRSAVDDIVRLRPDIALLDLDMPEMNGLQAAQRISEKVPQVRNILFTGHDHLTSLANIPGVAEALLKTCTPEELKEAILRVFRRSASMAPRLDGGGVTEKPEEAFAIIARFAQSSALSEKERQVVEKMVTTELTASQIALEISRETGVKTTESAVKHALERALTKMEIEPRTRAALIRRVLQSRVMGG